MVARTINFNWDSLFLNFKLASSNYYYLFKFHGVDLLDGVNLLFQPVKSMLVSPEICPLPPIFIDHTLKYSVYLYAQFF